MTGSKRHLLMRKGLSDALGCIRASLKEQCRIPQHHKARQATMILVATLRGYLQDEAQN